MMKKYYEVLFYSGDGLFPTYYRVEEIKAQNIKKEFKDKLGTILKRIREIFNLEKDIPDWKIYDALYIIQEDGLIPVRSVS